MKLLRRALTLPRDGRPWRVELSWGMTAAGIMAAVYALLTVVFSVIPFPFRLHGKLPHPLALDGAACVMMLGAMLAMLYFLPERGRLADKLGLAPINRRDLRIVLVGLAAAYTWEFSITPLWEMLLRALNITWKENQNLLELCASGSWRRFAVLLALTGILTPVMEEILFRRLLYALLRPLGVAAAVAAGAVIFAAAHLFLHGLPALAGIGAAFQWVYLRSGNLAAAMLAHTIFNLIALAVAFFIGV